ncbi:putative type III secretion system needle protein SctF [Neochlamydia sp. EPS4]|jgi:hypothetical protein|uniref:DUF5407 family protein n=1 Tax=unclassified Neochlamydia TaxID=2643326 RepID=UPI00057E624D|nr:MULTISPECIES: DUF5407 family protein [unclassified Neochlamydia]KIC71663.1 putative type III secretion system needle protein SctF [Neochlamydia sp. TUME1]KIC76048.1 putative type III secretion system needle protein SctF [Neochlamydia sp. EPS4]MBS4166572.1 Uncharacterized protein [Neochlamydia sp. AcF65]MBS4170465.1 Uncharacterized protein [Neochlamydia sp. AcF95]NGY95403.1 hypothetical protein [Neochlamydia sp. AcF84]
MSSNSNQSFPSAPTSYSGANRQSGFEVQSLIGIINNAVSSAKAKLLQIQNNRSSISIGDMFEMQMLMNHLSQLSEMTTDIVSASNTAISSMARNIKS